MSARYRLLRVLVVALARLFFGLQVLGTKAVPPHGPIIVAANHRRHADPVLVSMAVPRKVRWMAKKEVFVGPFAHLLRFAGAFPVDRRNGGRAALKSALVFLGSGEVLGIFPEGAIRAACHPDGDPKSGVALLAARTGAPIIPVFIGEAPTVTGRLLKGQRLRVHIGTPIVPEPAALLDAKERRRAYEALTGSVMSAIYDLEPARRRRKTKELVR